MAQLPVLCAAYHIGKIGRHAADQKGGPDEIPSPEWQRCGCMGNCERHRFRGPPEAALAAKATSIDRQQTTPTHRSGDSKSHCSIAERITSRPVQRSDSM